MSERESPESCSDLVEESTSDSVCIDLLAVKTIFSGSSCTDASVRDFILLAGRDTLRVNGDLVFCSICVLFSVACFIDTNSVVRGSSLAKLGVSLLSRSSSQHGSKCASLSTAQTIFALAKYWCKRFLLCSCFLASI